MPIAIGKVLRNACSQSTCLVAIYEEFKVAIFINLQIVSCTVSSGDKCLCRFCEILSRFYPDIQCDTGCTVCCQFCTVCCNITAFDRFCAVASVKNAAFKFGCCSGVRICDRVSCCIFYFCRNRLIDPVPDKSTLCIRVVTENIPVLFEVTKGITHCMGIF